MSHNNDLCSRSEALSKAKDHAKVLRESKGSELIGMDELNDTSRSPVNGRK